MRHTHRKSKSKASANRHENVENNDGNITNKTPQPSDGTPVLEKIVAACERDDGEIILFARQENSEEIYTDSPKNIGRKWPHLLLQFYDKYITFDSTATSTNRVGKKQKAEPVATQTTDSENDENSMFRILGVNEIDGEKHFLVERSDTAETVIVNQKVAYKKYADLVVKFYEEHLRWEDIR